MSNHPMIALIAVTGRGLDQARCLRERLRTGEIFRPDRYGPPSRGREQSFDGPLSERVPELFAGSTISSSSWRPARPPG